MTPARLVASGFYTGYAPFAPGTFGSLLGLLLGAVLLHAGHLPLLLGIAAAAAAGIWSIKGKDAATDPGWIVIDEILGQLVALLALSHAGPLGLLLAFALFRVFDIAKPGPIAWIDAQPNAWGIMGDDALAGVAAALCLFLLRLVIPL